ncbi:MAG TPA: DUF6755 family protein [Acidimicrobiales bacterium]
MAEPHPPAGVGRRHFSAPAAVGVYVLVLLVLQIFLLTVALDAFHAYDAGLAWAAAVTSMVLTAGVVVVERLLGRRGGA